MSRPPGAVGQRLGDRTVAHHDRVMGDSVTAAYRSPPGDRPGQAREVHHHGRRRSHLDPRRRVRRHRSRGRDLTTVWAGRADGGFHHTAVALLGRDIDGDLQVVRSANTAEHLHWGGALLGGPVLVLAPAAGADLLRVGGRTGAGAIVGHVRRNADPVALGRAAALVHAAHDQPGGRGGEPAGRRHGRVPAQASVVSTVDLHWGDLEAELSRDFVHPLPETLLLAG